MTVFPEAASNPDCAVWPTRARHNSSELAEYITGYVWAGSPKYCTKVEQEHVSNRGPQYCSPLTKGSHCRYLPCLDSGEAKTLIAQIPDNKFCCSRTSVALVPQFPHLPQSIWQCNPPLQVLHTDLILALAKLITTRKQLWAKHNRNKDWKDTTERLSQFPSVQTITNCCVTSPQSCLSANC